MTAALIEEEPTRVGFKLSHVWQSNHVLVVKPEGEGAALKTASYVPGAAQRAMLPALSGIEAQLMELARLGSVPG